MIITIIKWTIYECIILQAKEITEPNNSIIYELKVLSSLKVSYFNRIV